MMRIVAMPSMGAALRMLVVLAVLGLTACGGGGGTSEAPPPAPLQLAVPGQALMKLRAVGSGGWAGLSEIARPLENMTTPERRLLLAPDGGSAPRLSYAPPAGWSLIDFAVHQPSRQLSLVLASDRQLRLLRLAADGQLLHEQDFLDPLVASDPFIGDPLAIRDPQSLVPYASRDAARLAPLGEDLLLGFRSGRQAVVLHRLGYGAATGFGSRWRSLVEPGVFIGVRGISSGTFDPFKSLDNQWRLLLDADAQGRIAVAVNLDTTDLIEGHRQHFAEPLDPSVANGLLLSQFGPDGRRLGTLLLDTRQRSEPQALRWVGERVAVAGRVRSVQTPEGWDAYVALVAAGTAAPTTAPDYALIDVDQGEVLFDLAPLANGQLLAVGSAGYTQNPFGGSISEPAQPLLVQLAADGRLIQRLSVAAGPRHNQLRALLPWQGGWLLAGMENGPGTHSADADPRLLVADGYVREQRQLGL